MTSPLIGTPAAEGASRVGTVISGRYLIKALLGEGGMGSVYLAEHTHMKKRVALKLLHPEMVENAEVSARFEREAMAAAHIEHPNVAAATDFGKTDDGAFFLVLEYVEGTSLRDALAAGPLSVTRALRITRQIALALERAHESGIVHRDLKPENVMLVKKDPEPDFVKVLDFGIAKILEGAASASAGLAKRNASIGKPNEPLTRLGTILGTPEYMAPEQALGEAVTPAADLYGVGVMFYEMLTGKHPFEPPDRTAMLSFHIVAPVPHMKDRAPDVDVPPMVEAIARCLLEKDSKKRYPSARALIEAIEVAALASGLDVAGSSVTPSQPNVDGSARAPGWGEGDAFAKTKLGMTPSPTATTASGASAASGAGAGATSAAPPSVPASKGGIFATLGRQPRPVLYALAAAVPLGFVLLVVVLVVALRGPKVGVEPVTGAHGADTAPSARPKTAPTERVQGAVALGPDALEALAKEFPEDATIPRKLAVSYQAHRKSAEAMRTVRALLVSDPSAVNDDEIVDLVAATASTSPGAPEDEAFALLEGPLGERGVDALIELASRGQAHEAVRARKSLAKPDVRAHASAPAAVLLDLKSATGCVAKRELLGRAKDQGDARLLPVLKSLKATRGCGFIGRGDCWPCLRRDSALDDAMAAVEERAATVQPK